MAPFFIAEYAIKFQTVSQSVSEWLGLSRRWPLVISSLINSGPGVPAEEMEHITEPFFRGEQAKKYPGGSGLGMSIVKHCVEACGGELHYYNQYPKGFTVSITLKACDK